MTNYGKQANLLAYIFNLSYLEKQQTIMYLCALLAKLHNATASFLQRKKKKKKKKNPKQNKGKRTPQKWPSVDWAISIGSSLSQKTSISDYWGLYIKKNLLVFVYVKIAL